MASFTITDNKGFRMQFANGWAVSVQWGPGNYCENYNLDFAAPKAATYWYSLDAECAVFNPSGKMVKLDPCTTVRGRMTADEVATLIHQVATGTMWFMVPDYTRAADNARMPDGSISASRYIAGCDKEETKRATAEVLLLGGVGKTHNSEEK